jgi:hypothetical protein
MGAESITLPSASGYSHRHVRVSEQRTDDLNKEQLCTQAGTHSAPAAASEVNLAKRRVWLHNLCHAHLTQGLLP